MALLILKNKGVGIWECCTCNIVHFCFGPNYLCKNWHTPRTVAWGRGVARPNENDSHLPPEMAKRDPLFPVIIITGISDSFKIKHLAISMPLDPCQSLHLVFAPVRAPRAMVPGPCKIWSKFDQFPCVAAPRGNSLSRGGSDRPPLLSRLPSLHVMQCAVGT